MLRRDFLRLTAHVSSLVLAGRLPLLAADRLAGRKRRPEIRPARRTSPAVRNIFTEPPAVEPVTGYLERFQPVSAGSMQGSFTARYDLIGWGTINNKTGKPRNGTAGSLKIVRKVRGGKIIYQSVELRTGQTGSRVTATLNCRGELDAVENWKVISDVINGRDTQAPPLLTFEEQGYVQNNTVVQQNKISTVKLPITHALVPQEALPALLAGGIVKSGDLLFDMLQNGSVIKPDQTLHYSGQIRIPVAGSTAEMDCYAQTGYGILPTHYLVDRQGRIQLITQENTNWVLKELS